MEMLFTVGGKDISCRRVVLHSTVRSTAKCPQKSKKGLNIKIIMFRASLLKVNCFWKQLNLKIKFIFSSDSCAMCMSNIDLDFFLHILNSYI